VKVHVLHENPDWYAPLGAAFDAAGLPYEQWLLGDGALDLDDDPPAGVFWSRMSAARGGRLPGPAAGPGVRREKGLAASREGQRAARLPGSSRRRWSNCSTTSR
jgi:hypothetical protein